jgi:HEAT repeat protein
MGLEKTFKILAESNMDAAREALIGALVEPSDNINNMAISAALDHENRDALTFAVRNFHNYAKETRDNLATNPRPMMPVLHACLKDPAEQTRLNTLEIVNAIGRADVGHLAVLALGDTSTAVRDRAAAVLTEMTQIANLAARTSRGSRSPEPVAAISKTAVADLLVSALRNYRLHREKAVLSSLVDLGDIGQWGLLSTLAEPQSHAKTDLLTLLREKDSPGTVWLLFKMLSEKSLCDTANEILAERRDRGFARAISAFLSDINESDLQNLASAIRQMPWWGCVMEAIDELGRNAVVKLVHMVLSSRISDDEKTGKIMDLMGSRDEACRAAALRTAVEASAPGIEGILTNSVGDRSEEVQLAVVTAIIARQMPNRNKVLLPLISSNYESVRRAVSKELATDSFNRYLQSFDKLDPQTREMAGKAIAKMDMSVIEKLGDELHSLDADRRLKALHIVSIIDKEKELGDSILELMRDPDRKIRATVIKAAGYLGSIEAIRALIGSLSDPDRRIRANAMEAFEDIGNPKLAGLLLPFLKDSDNRVRANAAKALWALGHPETKVVLEDMLSDPQELMRLSAVWALGEINYPGVTDLLKNVAEQDSSQTVRDKAAEIVDKLKG